MHTTAMGLRMERREEEGGGGCRQKVLMATESGDPERNLYSREDQKHRH